jgi:hypothetical protein
MAIFILLALCYNEIFLTVNHGGRIGRSFGYLPAVSPGKVFREKGFSNISEVLSG